MKFKVNLSARAWVEAVAEIEAGTADEAESKARQMPHEELSALDWEVASVYGEEPTIDDVTQFTATDFIRTLARVDRVYDCHAVIRVVTWQPKTPLIIPRDSLPDGAADHTWWSVEANTNAETASDLIIRCWEPAPPPLPEDAFGWIGEQ